MIGGGDFAGNHIIPDLIRGLTSNKPTLIRNAQATRPWQHIREPLMGYLRYTEETLFGMIDLSALNFGPFESSLKLQRILEMNEENLEKI